MTAEPRDDPRVAVAATRRRDYGPGASADILSALTAASGALGFHEPDRGPLGALIPAGSRVVIKPNLVLHENRGPWGMLPLVTNLSVIQAAAEAVLQADPATLVVADAPIQSCNFDQLLEVTGLGQWARVTAAREPRFGGVRDIRRTTCGFDEAGVRVAVENRLPEDQFVLFDLGRESMLEPITDREGAFRVTCYDPRLMARTHAPGRHQYLISRVIIESDVVVNLPKLKTHMKAGITSALKNLVGINGNKEFLPHHRVGGAKLGGDCYPGGSRLKRTLEFVADRENSTRTKSAAWLWHQAGRVLHRAVRLSGDELGIEGAWSGNDTVWRTCLDLNRILLYGRPDGTLAESPVRRVVHVVDAVIAGQGNGPLASQPLPLGLVIVGQNAAAVDRVGASILGYDPDLVPLVREAFQQFRWPLASFRGEDVQVVGGGLPLAGSLPPILYPPGWRDAGRAHRPTLTA